FELPQQGDEIRHAETVMPYLDHVTQRASLELARQQLEELAEIGLVELFGRRELPEHRTQPVAELQPAEIKKAFHGIAALRQHATVGSEARPLQREHKSIRHFTRPFPKTLGLLRA